MISRTLLSRAAACLCAGALLTSNNLGQTADDKPDAKPKPAASEPPLDPLSSEAEKVAEDLQKRLPPGSEARLMLDDILQGKRLGPDDGWFRTAVAQTRFTWKDVAKRYDANHDGKITAEEFGGPKADFRRLDRDGDGAVTEKDLAWKAHALALTPGAMLFLRADRDGNGRITPEEWNKLFQSLKGDGADFLSLSDLQDQLSPPEDDNRPRSAHPTRNTLVLALSRQELGSHQPGPGLGSKAPDFSLRTVEGDRQVTLGREIGRQPVVLVFGNFTCGPFRAQAGNVEKLYARYKDRAKFFMIYVREAHPREGWWAESNRRYGIDLSQPTTDEERRGVAETCQKRLGFGMPFLVDGINDKVGATYSGMPSRLYLIDSAGQVAYKSGRGPFGFKPGELEQALVLLLRESIAASPSPGAKTEARD